MSAAERTPDEGRGTLVLICQRLATLGSGLDLGEMRALVTSFDADVAFEVVPGLCERPGEISRAAALRPRRLVLGLCCQSAAPTVLQAEIRKLGLDPFGVEVVDLGTYCALAYAAPLATRTAAIVLAAACSRAEAFGGSRPEHAKAYLARSEQRLSRRSLLALPLLGYRPVPSIAHDLCVTASGCNLCLRACPANALRRRDGTIEVDGSRCESCGICVTACPCYAVEFPTQTAAQVEAQLATLLSALRTEAPGPRAVLIACRDAATEVCSRGGFRAPLDTLWLPLDVACDGGVPVGWIPGSSAAAGRRCWRQRCHRVRAAGHPSPPRPCSGGSGSTWPMKLTRRCLPP